MVQAAAAQEYMKWRVTRFKINAIKFTFFPEADKENFKEHSNLLYFKFSFVLLLHKSCINRAIDKLKYKGTDPFITKVYKCSYRCILMKI